MAMLTIQDVHKEYTNKKAVDGVSITVPKGAIFGLLGPNGAGKTSLIRIITSIVKADKGTVLFDGEPLKVEHTQQIGYLPEERGLYKKMKVGEHLLYLARLRGMGYQDAQEAVGYWLNRFDIVDWAKKKVEELSKGMQQKVQFVATVMHKPPLLILDEPFSGLDPINTNLIKSEIDRLSEEGVTIIFSTHRMEQVEEFCEYIALINNGRCVLQGPMADIKQQFKRHRYEFTYDGALAEDFAPTASRVIDEPGHVILQFPHEINSRDILQEILDKGITPLSFREILPSLNEIFIQQVENTQ